MAYGAVHETFWDDPKMRALTERGRMLMLYLLTCRHKDRLGCFVLDPHYAAADLQWSVDEVRGVLDELANAKRIEYDAEHRVVLIPRYLRHNPMPNPNIVTAAVKDLERLPQTPLTASLYEWVARENNSRYAEVLHALRNRLGNRLPNGLSNGLPNHLTREELELELEKELEQEEEVDGADAPASSPSTTDAAQSNDFEAQASEIIRAANHGMVHNDRIDAKRFRPIEMGHGSRSFVVEWLQDGIPFDLILQTVTERARAYRPGGRRQQISTMSYFEKAVLDEWERRQALPPPGSQAAAIRDEYPGNGRTSNRTGPVRVDGYDPEKEERERQRKELEAIAEWCRHHPDDAAEIRQQIEDQVSNDKQWKGLPVGTVQRVVEGLYRERVHQRIEAA